jgi:hypothetical protein
MDMFKLARDITFDPAKYTKKTSKNYKEPFIYLLFVGIFYSIGLALVTYIISYFALFTGASSLFVDNTLATLGAVGIPITIIMFPVGGLIFAAIFHGFGKLFRIYKHDLLRTYSSMAHSNSPTLFFGWIPFINLIGAIWSIIVLIYSLANQHGITKLRALISVLITIVVIAVVVGVIVGTLAYWAVQFIDEQSLLTIYSSAYDECIASGQTEDYCEDVAEDAVQDYISQQIGY